MACSFLWELIVKDSSEGGLAVTQWLLYICGYCFLLLLPILLFPFKFPKLKAWLLATLPQTDPATETRSCSLAIFVLSFSLALWSDWLILTDILSLVLSLLFLLNLLLGEKMFSLFLMFANTDWFLLTIFLRSLTYFSSSFSEAWGCLRTFSLTSEMTLIFLSNLIFRVPLLLLNRLRVDLFPLLPV